MSEISRPAQSPLLGPAAFVRPLTYRKAKNLTGSIIHNQLLRLLPANVADSVMQSAEFVHLDLRESISEPNVPMRSVVFPESGVISVLLQMEDQSLNEISTVGNEGMIGLNVAMGVKSTQEVINCQVTGTAYAIPTDTFASMVEKHKELKRICDLYSMTLIDRISRNAACKSSHDVSQRCARWLLQTQDHCLQKEFVLTQEFLALMLGVSRTSVNISAGILAKNKLISYVRGKVKVLDREGLENVSCSCYASIKSYAARVFQGKLH